MSCQAENRVAMRATSTRTRFDFGSSAGGRMPSQPEG